MKCSEISLSVIMPIYNEEDDIVIAIEQTISEFNNFKKAELIVINDGSDDDTNKKLIDLSIKYLNLTVLEYNRNEGLAKSLKYCFLNVLNDYILFDSADFPLNSKDICNIIEQKAPFDLLVLERKGFSEFSNWRIFVSVFNRVLLHIFFPLALIEIADCNYAFIIKKEVLKKVFPKTINSNFIETEIILRAKYLKYNIKTIETKYKKIKSDKKYFKRIRNIIYSLKDLISFRIYSILLILSIKK